MLVIPIETADHKHDAVIIVLDKDNVRRMQEADPGEAILRDCGKQLVNPTLLLCYEEDSPAFRRAIQTNDLPALVKFLQRGWRFRPDKGDHDRGPQSIHKSN